MPDTPVLLGRGCRPFAEDEQVEDEPPLERRRVVDDAWVTEELAQIGTQRRGGGRVGSAELDEEDAQPTGRCPWATRCATYFFLQPGPSFASCFSVMCPSPAALRAVDFSALSGV